MLNRLTMHIGDAVWTEKLFAGAKSLEISLSEEEGKALAIHAEMLVLWNARVNLTAITEPEEVLEKHLLDSLAVLPFLPESGSILDMGTGGGFPGITIALMRPDLDVFMVDSVGKKMAFVRDVIRKLGLPKAKAESLRVEELKNLPGKAFSFDCIVSRAFSSLEQFCAWSFPLLASSGKILAMKGPEGLHEAETLFPEGASCTFSPHPYQLPFGGGSRVILEIFRSSLT